MFSIVGLSQINVGGWCSESSANHLLPVTINRMLYDHK
jgi:hypothetical protein